MTDMVASNDFFHGHQQHQSPYAHCW